MCITVEKKFEKVENWKFKLALKFLKKSWKSRKIRKSLFFKMVDFWHFVFAFCVLYFVFLSFSILTFGVLLLIGHWVSLTLERLISNSHVVIDHQNRHHHHQMSIWTPTRGENVFGRITRKYTAQIRKYTNTKTIDRTRWRCPTFLRLCTKCIWDQIQFAKPVSMHIGRSWKCVDDDDDDSGGRTQRSCLRSTAPRVRVILTEAKTNTVCICEQVFLAEDRLDFFRDFFAFLKFFDC